MLTGRRILLGVTGGIAAYKACELARMFIREGAWVRVVMTPDAASFVTPLTFSALTGQDALVSEFPPAGGQTSSDPLAHLNLTNGIDCFVIAPVTANTLGKLAAGLADNLLCAAFLSNQSPVVLAPAMNPRMWASASVTENVATLKRRGFTVVEPEVGEMACGEEGAGRLAGLEEIFSRVVEQMSSAQTLDLKGKRIIVTAGGTREYLDPVRFMTNASTGTLGVAVCREYLNRGADVVLVDTGIGVPEDLTIDLTQRIEVRTAFDLQKTLKESMDGADGLTMLAAVADYCPADYQTSKRKKDGQPWVMEFDETPDILAGVAEKAWPGQAMIGVSLEDTDWLNRGMKKAAKKHVGLIIAVELAGDLPFGESRINCALVTETEVIAGPALRTKAEVAGLVADWLAGWYAANPG